jgi:putative acyl-CoA dehydrogenase
MTTPEPELANQSPPYEDVNLFESDRPLRDAVTGNAAGADREALAAFGRRWGSADMFERGRLPAVSAATLSSSIRPITP